MSTLARVFRFFHVVRLLCCQSVSLVKAMLEISQGFLVAHYFPSVEEDVGFAGIIFPPASRAITKAFRSSSSRR